MENAQTREMITGLVGFRSTETAKNKIPQAIDEIVMAVYTA